MHDVMCIDPVFCTNYEKNHTQRIVATTRCGKETVPACFYFERGLSKAKKNPASFGAVNDAGVTQ